ncbi:hypothetical protein E0H73_35860 [Kribbella pittospori]|uniref:Uncharacterized protein n=1 Tax=Kribbella pittospori TaxID=722689 RepID=A0A4R0K6R5_9ACTN|nr:hypothetical protein [Kribbella pittospori]TCC55309.1 hypothetical protein E0H73_35860 [Kribbella pittospori]
MRWPVRALVALASGFMLLLGGACTRPDDSEPDVAAHPVGAWPLRGNLTGDRALLDAARERLEAEGHSPGRWLLATRVEGLTLLVAETPAHDGSHVALYGRAGTPVPAMRIVDLGKPTNASSISLGIDNTIAAMALVVPAPNVTRVAIKSGVGPGGAPIMVDVPIRDGVAALPLKGQRPANTLIELDVGGQVVGAPPELQAFDVDDPVQAQPDFKPGLETTPASDSYGRNYTALWSFVGLLAFGVAAWLAASRLRSRLSMRPADGRWSRAALAAIVLALVTPLVQWAASDAMYALAYSDPSFDASGLFLQVVPAVLVSAAGVRSARTGLREVHGQTSGRALAISATVVAYVAAGLMLVVALLSLIATAGQGG